MPVSEAIHIGQEFNHAIRVVGTDIHKGPLPSVGQFVNVAPDNLVVSAIKKAEDSNALVVRLFNPTQRNVTVRIAFDPELVGALKAAQEVDLLERPLSKAPLKPTRNSIRVRVPTRAIASVLVKLSKE